jgi:hypothetical protein
MDRPDSVPQAVSFRQLEQWRQQAAEPPGSSGALRAAETAPGAPGADPAAALEQLLGQYEQLTQDVLRELSRQAGSLHRQRTGEQLMALGALSAHLRLALQALAASRR